MCDFVSTIEAGKDVFFLTNSDLKPKKLARFKKENPEWYDDIMGHGALQWFYPDLKGKGIHKEYTDFSTPDNLPIEIVNAIKNLEMTQIGMDLGLLNEAGVVEYEKIRKPAWDEYEKITKPARDEYEKIINPAWDEYEKITNRAQDEYCKIINRAWDEYNKNKLSIFWKIFKVEKFRNSKWR